jgi:hypothetical protein
MVGTGETGAAGGGTVEDVTEDKNSNILPPEGAGEDGGCEDGATGTGEAGAMEDKNPKDDDGAPGEGGAAVTASTGGRSVVVVAADGARKENPLEAAAGASFFVSSSTVVVVVVSLAVADRNPNPDAVGASSAADSSLLEDCMKEKELVSVPVAAASPEDADADALLTPDAALSLSSNPPNIFLSL